MSAFNSFIEKDIVFWTLALTWLKRMIELIIEILPICTVDGGSAADIFIPGISTGIGKVSKGSPSCYPKILSNKERRLSKTSTESNDMSMYF